MSSIRVWVYPRHQILICLDLVAQAMGMGGHRGRHRHHNQMDSPGFESLIEGHERCLRTIGHGPLFQHRRHTESQPEHPQADRSGRYHPPLWSTLCSPRPVARGVPTGQPRLRGRPGAAVRGLNGSAALSVQAKNAGRIVSRFFISMLQSSSWFRSKYV